MSDSEIGVRIGELSRRAGVSTDVLRAWERRYGLLTPRRSGSGQRLYSPSDEQRVRRMRESIGQGYSAQVAARLALAEPPDHDVRRDGKAPASPTALPSLDSMADRLRDALDDFDDAGANGTLDRLLAAYGVDTVLRDVILPLLHSIGERWANAEVTVAQEHFASALLIGRLRSLARGWDQGSGPRALVACPAGEAHDIGLLCFSLLLRERGYRISYLGASVPGDALFDAAERLEPAVIVLSAVREEPFWNSYEALSELSDAFVLAIGGAGATPALGEQLRAQVLPHDPVAAADAVSVPKHA